MSNPKARNWHDAAGTNPATGERWRVCDLVRTGEQILGSAAHNHMRGDQFRAWWETLGAEQRQLYNAAAGRRPRRRS